MEKPENAIIVIFGASGDLTSKKLVPAFYNLFKQKLFCGGFAILGAGRTPMTDHEFRDHLLNKVPDFKEEQKNNPEVLQNFLSNFYYVSLNTSDEREYSKLKQCLAELDKKKNTNGNYLYYLATPPQLYEAIAQSLAANKLNVNENGSKRKIIIEKPFGINLQSAQALNERLHKIFSENQIYRIDHYLGKETVQNILVFRFSNGIFEPMWNRNFIDHVEITSAEFEGVDNRGGYYDSSGAIRDMIQNHMLQLLGFMAMEPPSSFEADAVRNETLKVFQSLRPINEQDVERFVIRGQYTSSVIRGEEVKSYRDEKNIKPESRTETYAALKLYIDNWRWGGVPFYIRAGKRLPTKVTEAVIHFKKTPHHLFAKYNTQESANQLIIRIQPDEGILLKFGIKSPGSGYKIQTANMDFHYSDIRNIYIPSAYERLLLDCMLGDSTLYARADAVEQCWKFIDPVLSAWENNPAIKVYGYPAGTWGPIESAQLFDDAKTEWRYPCKNLTDDGLYCEL